MATFEQMKAALEEQGWYVGWNHYCCQSCGWDDVPWEADLDKVLFNHSQDCEVELDVEECEFCEGCGVIPDDVEEEYIDCPKCKGLGRDLSSVDTSEYLVDGHFVCYTPHQQKSSLFCFSGSEKGVENLSQALSTLDDIGIRYNWSGTPNQRIELMWD